MSKLDDILSQASDAIAKGVVLGEWNKVETKKQIKDMVLQLIRDSGTKVKLVKAIEKL